jgi:hypothetical protein
MDFRNLMTIANRLFFNSILQLKQEGIEDLQIIRKQKGIEDFQIIININCNPFLNGGKNKFNFPLISYLMVKKLSANIKLFLIFSA